MKRLSLGYLVAPLWIPVAAGIAATRLTPPGFLQGAGPTPWVLGVVMFGVIVGYLGTALIGTPMHLLLRRWRASAGIYAASWFITALAVWALLFLAAFASYGLGFSIDYLIETITRRPYVPLGVGLVWSLVGMTF